MDSALLHSSTTGAAGGGGGPLQVLLNVYDVAQQGDNKLVRLNNLVGPKGLGLGGACACAVLCLCLCLCVCGAGVSAESILGLCGLLLKLSQAQETWRCVSLAVVCADVSCLSYSHASVSLSWLLLRGHTHINTGVFHGAIVLGTVEFSFGFCDQGTGVYAVKVGVPGLQHVLVALVLVA